MSSKSRHYTECDLFTRLLPDHTPSDRDAVRYIEEEFKEAITFPIVVIAIDHDGPVDALKKKRKK